MKQLKCPSCGATLNQSFPNQLIVECPYCHQQVVNETYQSSGKDNEPRVLEFRMTENEVVNQIVNSLIKDKSVPTDIFDKMKNISVNRFYVPMFIFEGTFRAPWTAEKSRQEKRQRIGRDGKIENYEETLYDYFNGEAAGNFYVNGIPSNEISVLNLNSESIQRIIVNPSQLSLFSEVQLGSNNIDNIKILSPSKDSNSVWWESGELAAQDIGVSSACHQAQGHVTSCSASCELKKTSFIYIPLWKMEYEYNNNMFNSIYYAEQFIDYNHPIGEKIEAQPTEEQQFVLHKYNKRDTILSKINNYGCLLITLVGFIGCWGIQKYRSSHYLDANYDYYGHSGDDFHFLLNMFYAGIALLVIGFIISFIMRRKYGIDDIETDIANRTQILQNEADNYRKKTGEAFLKHFSNYSRESSAEHERGNFNSDVKKKDSYENQNFSPLYATSSKSKKFCSHCGKEINGTHKFCRYCGAKL